MIHEFSVCISKRMGKSAIIPSEQVSVYAYGMELVISSAVGVAILISLSVLAKKSLLWIPYLAGFIPLRLTGGGYHAHTHLGCLSMFSTVYGLLLFLITITYYAWWSLTLCAGFALAVVLFLSPVQATNKPLKEWTRKKNRQKSIVLGLINCGIPVLCRNLSHAFNQWLLMYYMGYNAAILSMLVAASIQKGGRKKSEKTNESFGY